MSASTAAPESGTSAPNPVSNSVPARMLGVIFTPRATYAAVAARPRALGMLLAILVIGGAGIFTFLSTDVGRVAVLDQQVETMKSFGVNVTEPMIDRMEQGAARQRFIAPVFQAVFMTLAAALIAGLAFAVFNAILGGDGSFKQVFAIVVHSGAIITVQQLFGLPLAYAREKMTSTTNLAVFAPFLDENSFPARLLGSVDLFIIWWLMSLAIGLGVLYRKRTTPIATSLIAIYVLIGVVIAAIKTAAAGA